MTTTKSNNEVRESWWARAKKLSRLHKQSRVGVETASPVRVPCGTFQNTSGYYEMLSVVDVPAQGNCLYHAVWASARLQGISRPFDMCGVDNVYCLRVKVAERALMLLNQGIIDAFDEDEHIAICDLIASPGQYVDASGWISMMAIAHMLGRSIVVMSNEGITTVVPHRFEIFRGRKETGGPIPIYHGSVDLQNVVSYSSRNHYAAVILSNTQAAHLPFAVDRHRCCGQNQFSVDSSTSLPAVSKKRRRHDLDTRSTTKRHTGCESENVDENDALLQSLRSRATTLTNLTSQELKVLNQNFSNCPQLGLLYFHCCSNDPKAFVFNDEKLLGSDAATTRTRLMEVLESPSTAEEIEQCQNDARKRSSEEIDLRACASCCEILQNHNGATFLLAALSDQFRYTVEEEEKIRSVPRWIVQDHLQVLESDGIYYHLNPDLVSDLGAISVCQECAKNPRAVRYSIAAGHDYGRISSLPLLNDVAKNCISPVRCFGLELSLSGKHTTGHAVCFPSTGPQSCADVLPSTSIDCFPRVTFVGPSESWRLKKKQFRKLYELPVVQMYKWLKVLQHTHSGFRNRNIRIDNSKHRHQQLHDMEAYIERSILFEQSTAAASACEQSHSERFGGDVAASDDEHVVLTKSCLLRSPTETVSTNTPSPVISALLELLEEANGDKIREGHQGVIPIQRTEEPILEWANNGEMIACAFPQLFLLGGDMLPQGSWPTHLLQHLMKYYDGRFEQSATFIALQFNQHQRHSAVRRAATVGNSQPALLERFGSLINSCEFRERLTEAKKFPDLGASKKLHASLLRILSLVGGCVPFSPFERAAARPKISALRCRFGVPLKFVTGAPPEQDSLLLHRIAMIRSMNCWNRHDIFSNRQCTFDAFPGDLRENARSRLAISNTYPALSVEVFKTFLNIFFDDVIRCGLSSSIRTSRSFNQRQRGAYGRIAAHCTVVEAQVDGRLHSHTMIYGSSYTPQLLTRISCCPVLRERTAQWIESICTTKLQPEIHSWISNLDEAGEHRPRAFNVPVPSATVDLDSFFFSAEKHIALTNVHTHSATCRKGVRGKYMCRLARPAGQHNGTTQPLSIVREKPGNLSKGVRPVLGANPLDASTCRLIDSGYNANNGHLFPPFLPGPVVWEIQRPATDTMVVETNRVLAALSGAHTNSAIVNGEDSGDMVEQYQQKYMTKEEPSLRTAIPVVVSAIDHVLAHPSRADDRDTDSRRGKYLASRIVNAFSGAHEWSHSVMIFALLGNRSFMSSETFWYIFPHPLVRWMRSKIATDETATEGKTNNPEDIPGHNSSIDPVQCELEQLVEIANNESIHAGARQFNSFERQSGGTRAYRLGNNVIFVSQLQSYLHRGPYFADYSPLEFEAIVDVLPVRQCDQHASQGRHPRPGFPFSPNHPLYGFYNGYIRMKMHTPMFGGRPPSPWNDNAPMKAKKVSRIHLAQYILCTFTSWTDGKPIDDFNDDGLLQICKQWDQSNASLIDRQRYRYIRNFLKQGHRSSKHETILTDWRNRNADLWKDMELTKTTKSARARNVNIDPELNGLLGDDVDLYEMIMAITSKDHERRHQLHAFQRALLNVIGPTANEHVQQNGTHGVFKHAKPGNLDRIASQIREKNTSDPSKHMHVRDPLTGTSPRRINTEGLSSGQAKVVLRVITGLEENKQTLTMLHGGGGTGKSFVVRRICEEVEKRGFKVVSTCPTGAGACQLTGGRTFHSAFRISRAKLLSANALEQLKQSFDTKVALIVVDEVSMFSADLLLLLDERLRALYDSCLPFGGKSILLVGDFSQIEVVSGVSLCKVMYMDRLHPRLMTAKALFQQFHVCFLKQQQRASQCTIQQQRLLALRALPLNYPSGVQWSSEDAKEFRPISQELIQTLLRPLTAHDVERDPKWVDSSVTLVTSNVDRAAINACMVKTLARRAGALLFRWKKRISGESAERLGHRVDLLYDEMERPMLFGYFYEGARGQILDNASGNVARGIANGTMCLYHSVAWNDTAQTSLVLKLVKYALEHGQRIVELPTPPDYINVLILDRNSNPMSRLSWSYQDNIAHYDDIHNAESVVVPIGLVTSKSDQYSVKLRMASTQSDTKIHYQQHAVDLAMALTIWKAQGATFDRVLLLMDVSKGSPSWKFEHIYVAMSRIRAADHLRCIPTGFSFDQTRLLSLRPNIYTVKWRMDINTDGYWQEPHSTTRDDRSVAAATTNKY